MEKNLNMFKERQTNFDRTSEIYQGVSTPLQLISAEFWHSHFSVNQYVGL